MYMDISDFIKGNIKINSEIKKILNIENYLL